MKSVEVKATKASERARERKRGAPFTKEWLKIAKELFAFFLF
jgi:hypothetical protein